jgi:hypothetical protein
MSQHFYAVYGQKQIAAHGFQSEARCNPSGRLDVNAQQEESRQPQQHVYVARLKLVSGRNLTEP